MYAEVRAKLKELTAPILSLPPALRATQFSVDFQPLPAVIGKHSEAKGGNAMGLSGSDPDRIILIFQGAWNLPVDDAIAYDLGKQITDWVEQSLPTWLDEAGMSRDVYLPLFINDAFGDQPVMQSYKDYNKFKALQQQVDPNGLWSTRAGGFKY